MGQVGQGGLMSVVQFTVVVFIRQFYSTEIMSGTADLRCGEVKDWSIQPT